MAANLRPGTFLTVEERTLLAEIARSESVSLSRRARIILAVDAGDDPPQIAQQVALTERTVRKWITAFEEQRLGIFPDHALSVPAPVPALSVEQGLTVAELCRRYQVDMAHARHVAALAAALFELTQPLHGLDPSYREVVHTAGLLHNVAYAGGRAKHHTRGRDIVMEQPLADLSDEHRALVATITAFHRKAWKPSRLESEPSYVVLPDADKPVALTLSSLVRIADGLDYSQSQTTLLARSEAAPDGLIITVVGPFVEVDAGRAQEKADMWQALFDTPVIVSPFDETVFERGAVPPLVEPPLPKSPGVQPDDRMSEAGRKVLRFHFERMLVCEPGTRVGEDIEALHDMRVATRRMRAAFRVFGHTYEKATRRELLHALRRAGRRLGAVRDLDVFEANARHYLAALPVEQQHDLDPVFTYLQAHREKARQKLLRYLDSESYLSFTRRFGEFTRTPGEASLDLFPSGPEPVEVRHIAPRMIYQHYEAVRAFESVLPGAPVETLHQLRIACKHLRYTVEFFREVLGEGASDVIATLVRLQDHLGALNDASVAQGILRRIMKKTVKQARRAEALPPEEGQPTGEEELASLGGIAAYIEERENMSRHLQESLPDLWAEVVSPEMRRNLARAVGVL